MYIIICIICIYRYLNIYIYVMVDLKVLVRSFNCESRACYIGNPRESSFPSSRKIIPQQRKLGVFSHSKGPGPGRSSQIRTAHAWKGSPFPRESQARVPRFPGTGSQARFPGTGSQARFPGTGSQEVPRKRFPSKVSKQGSQEQVPKRFLGKARFPGTSSQARFPRFPKARFPSKAPEVPKQGFPFP